MFSRYLSTGVDKNKIANESLELWFYRQVTNGKDFIDKYWINDTIPIYSENIKIKPQQREGYFLKPLSKDEKPKMLEGNIFTLVINKDFSGYWIMLEVLPQDKEGNLHPPIKYKIKYAYFRLKWRIQKMKASIRLGWS